MNVANTTKECFRALYASTYEEQPLLVFIYLSLATLPEALKSSPHAQPQWTWIASRRRKQGARTSALTGGPFFHSFYRLSNYHLSQCRYGLLWNLSTDPICLRNDLWERCSIYITSINTWIFNIVEEQIYSWLDYSFFFLFLFFGLSSSKYLLR